MAQPVWTLSVDLQTKTATFETGMGAAAKTARATFEDIKSGSNEMGKEVGHSMGEARHGVIMLGEEFGIHLPRGLTTFIASLGPVGAAMEMAFPFIAIALGATLLLEHLSKLHEAGEKLTDNQVKFGTAVQTAFNQLDKQLLEAGIKADELDGNHLAALRKQLALINKTSMDELIKTFGELAIKADQFFAELKSNWYTVGIGSAGASHALSQFKAQYDALLTAGKDKEASDLLGGTRQSAQHVLDMMKQMKDSQAAPDIGKQGDYAKYEEAKNELKKAGVGLTEKEVQAQQILVDALNAQGSIQSRIQQLKNAQSGNAIKTEHKGEEEEADKLAKAQAEAERKGLEEAEKLRAEAYRTALSKLEQNEREQIDATETGSAARLAAIEAAIQSENRYGLQETGFYRSLLTSRVETVKQMTNEEAKLKEEAGKEQADHTLKMAMLVLAAEKEQAALRMTQHRTTAAQVVAEEVKASNDDLHVKLAAFQSEMAALDKHGKDYANKLKALQDKEAQTVKAHENSVTQIKDKAEEERNRKILSANTRFNDAIAQGLTQVLMRHESFGKMISQLGDQVVAGMMENAIKSVMIDDFGKEKDAAKAARHAYNSGMAMGGPAAMVIAPAWAALAFASVMAFQDGGVVPGTGKGDIVPAMLEPGEGVIPKAVMDAARTGGGDSSSGTHYHAHASFAPEIHAVDADGVDKMLKKHEPLFRRHIEGTLRKMNRG